MDAPFNNPDDNSLGDLFQQLVDDGRRYIGAEVGLYRQIALYRVGKARTGIIALAVGAVLALAALIALVIGLLLGLAVLIGPVGAGLVIAAVAGLAAYVAIRFGAGRLTALKGDAEEKAAIADGERLA